MLAVNFIGKYSLSQLMNWEKLANKIIKNDFFTKGYIWYAFFLISFTIGAFLRFYELSSAPNTLYIDEMQDLVGAKLALSDILPINSFSEFQNDFTLTLNGYFLSIWLFPKSVGIASRFPVALYGSLIPLPLFFLTKELFKTNITAFISSFLWEFSPLSIFMSRYAVSVELYPLFFFLVFIYLFVLFYEHKSNRSRRKIFFLVVVLSVIIISRDVLIWSIQDVVLLALFLLIFKIVSSRLNHTVNRRREYFLFAFVITIIAVILTILTFAKSTLLSLVSLPSNFSLYSIPIEDSINQLIIRIYYFLLPQNFIIFSLYPVNFFIIAPSRTPTLFISEALLAIPSFIFVVFNLIKKKMFFEYSLLLILFFGGLLSAIVNTANSPVFVVESEAIFSFPALTIMMACFTVYILRNHSAKLSNSTKKILKLYFARIIVIGVAILFVFNLYGFEVNIFNNYDKYSTSNPSTPLYPYYGLNLASNYLVRHNLTNDTIYYYPNTSLRGYVTLSTNNDINFYFYSMEYPLIYLKAYSNNTILSISLLNPYQLPVIRNPNPVIILSQNNSYAFYLANNGFTVNVLDTIDRPNGVIAWQILMVTAQTSGFNRLFTNSVLLSSVDNQTSIPINASLSSVYAHNFTLITVFELASFNQSNRFHELFSSNNGTINIGYSVGSNFPWVPPSLANSSFPYFQIQTINPHFGKIVAPIEPLQSNSIYLLALTFSNGIFSFYINSTLISSWTPGYQLYNLSTIFLENYEQSHVFAMLLQSCVNAGTEAGLYLNLTEEAFP